MRRAPTLAPTSLCDELPQPSHTTATRPDSVRAQQNASWLLRPARTCALPGTLPPAISSGRLMAILPVPKFGADLHENHAEHVLSPAAFAAAPIVIVSCRLDEVLVAGRDKLLPQLDVLGEL